MRAFVMPRGRSTRPQSLRIDVHPRPAGRGTARANPNGRGLEGFIALCTELGARTIEMFEPWLGDPDSELGALRDRLAASA